MKTAQNQPQVKERIIKGSLSDGGDEHVFTFPLNWEYEKCQEYIKKKNFNDFLIKLGKGDRITLHCAFSWKQKHFNLYGEWPK